MAQEFVVLNCCSCNRYQVQQSKKATKWLCKVCNHKQSVKQFFGRGSAKQCREIVQSLNSVNINGNDDRISHEINGKPDDSTHDFDILDYLLSNDEKNDFNNESNNDSNDEVPIAKKVKKSFGCDMGFKKANQLVVNKKVSKWDEFL